MSNDNPSKLVRYTCDINNLPPLSQGQQERIDKLANLPNEDIDFSDIPTMTDEQLTRFQPRQRKEMTSVRLDQDVLAWLRKSGKGWQTRLNSILRHAMREQV